ncbi:MAG: TatD family hydrolase [Clostridia bacterium]|nr:TatD family hydrolase [Clostridia bacterium]
MFDSHFHTTDPRLNSLPEVVQGKNHGVEIGADFASLPTVFAYAREHEHIYCTAGVHPEYADTYSANDFEHFVVEHLHEPKFVAIGECGLDYHRADLPSRAEQIAAFEHQIYMADRYRKPLVVHSRDAWEDTANVLIANRAKLKNGVLIHCMSYTAEQAKFLMSQLSGIEVYFAFGGHITYKSKAYLHDTLRAIPLNRILIETDAPYLAPVPKRGEINLPQYIQYTAETMARVLGKTPLAVETLTAENAYRFYKIKAAR